MSDDSASSNTHAKNIRNKNEDGGKKRKIRQIDGSQ